MAASHFWRRPFLFSRVLSGTTKAVKGTGYFALGLALGVLTLIAINKVLRDQDPEDAERLSERVGEHLRQLEQRLETAMHLEHA